MNDHQQKNVRSAIRAQFQLNAMRPPFLYNGCRKGGLAVSDRAKTEYLRPDSALPRYLMLPRFLLGAELPDGAKLLYALLLDRARLSMQNEGWTDARGRVFLIYTIRDLSAAMRRSESAVKVALRALEAAGLIRRERQGLGKANRLYLLTPVENDRSVRSNSIRQTGRNQPLNKNYRNKNNRTYICGEDESL